VSNDVKAPRAKRTRVLVVDDQADVADMVADGLAPRGFDVTAIADADEAIAAIDRAEHDALLTDLRMPGADGLELLRRSRAAAPDAPVIIMTAFSEVDSAIESIRRGAYHYLTKPFKVDELALFLRRALDDAAARRESRSLRRVLRTTFALDNVIGETPAMREIGDLVRRVADTDVAVLLLGETGTGKGVIARALHAESERAERPFVAVNCAALPENLLESELFGHARGAFTGATNARRGIFEQADGGTLFLDEIAEMSPSLQAKLLHVLETRRVRPLGDTREHEVDVRIVAATHRRLRERVADGSFREDLLYRLDVISIELPPLRARREDIPRLVTHFLAKFRQKHPNSPVERFDERALIALQEHAWPGNVRELEHAVERVVLLGRSRDATTADLPRVLTSREVDASSPSFGHQVVPLREMVRRYVVWAYERNSGHKRATCDALQIDAKTLNRWLDGVDTTS